MLEELLEPERRRCRSPHERISIIKETLQLGVTVSHVARLQGVNVNQTSLGESSTRKVASPQSWLRRCFSRLRTGGDG